MQRILQFLFLLIL